MIIILPLFPVYLLGRRRAFDKGKYLAWAALNLLYWEDFELGYRAWKQRVAEQSMSPGVCLP